MRVVALGASNLTRGLQALVDTSRRKWGGDVEILAALGHGRSYGQRSRLVARDLPGILESGLWKVLEERPPAPTRALVTDVGNDILYGVPPERILAWMDEAVTRLLRKTDDVVVAGLPMASIRDLRPWVFLLVRSVFFPPCRLTLAQVRERAETVFEGLRAIAHARGARFFALRPEWYGFDPIHIIPSAWDTAWAEMLGCPPRPSREIADVAEWLRLYALPAERQWLLGREVLREQKGVNLKRGGELFLF